VLWAFEKCSCKRHHRSTDSELLSGSTEVNLIDRLLDAEEGVEYRTKWRQLISLEEALEYIRNTDCEVWYRLKEEMTATLARRNREAAGRLKIGDSVTLLPPESNFYGQGRVVKVSRRGLVTLDIPSRTKGVIGPMERIVVEASTVRRCG